METGEIILAGKRCPVGAPVKLWSDFDPPLTFVGKKNTVKRTVPPDLIIWHWTGGENGPETIWNTLINRNLGVSFAIDRDGDENMPSTIYQYLDPLEWDPRDTGGQMGKRSISIEVANYGFRGKGQRIPTRGRDRIVDEERIHGVKLRVARFYPQQVNAIAALTKVLCLECGIPLKFPREADGTLALRELTNPEKRRFKGVISHFHKTDQKYDAGFWLHRELEHLEDVSSP